MTTIQDLIKQAKDQGFAVYAPKKVSSYFYFSKSDKVGYCQLQAAGDVQFSTVHKANYSTGTGYEAESFDEALNYVPAWVKVSGTVIKYASLKEFLQSHWTPLVLH